MYLGNSFSYNFEVPQEIFSDSVKIFKIAATRSTRKKQICVQALNMVNLSIISSHIMSKIFPRYFLVTDSLISKNVMS